MQLPALRRGHPPAHVMTAPQRAPVAAAPQSGGSDWMLWFVLAAFLLLAVAAKSSAGTAHGSEPPSSGKVNGVVTTAKSMVGTSHEIGIEGRKPLDGVTLTRRSFRAAGVTLPKTAAGQVRAGKPVEGLGAAKRGDLMAWEVGKGFQLGVYLGKGKVVTVKAGGKVREATTVDLGAPDVIRRVVV